MSLRFVHAADLHLDSPFIGLSANASPRISKTLRDATFVAYERIIDLCIEEKVDALLVAGDIYDGADRSLRAQQKFVAGLNRLEVAGIRSFICHGNHDPLSGWEAGLTLPPGCHRFGADVASVPFDLSDPSRGMVYGYSYPRQSVKDNTARQFKRDQPSGAAIGLLHCNLDGNTAHEPYAPCTTDDLIASEMDYWALGHVHTRRVVRSQAPAIVYPGNPQGRHPKETEARGVYLVSIDDANQVMAEFRVTDVVRWADVSVSIDGIDGLEELLTGIENAVGQALDDAAGRHLVYRLVLTGRGELHDALQRGSNLDDILASCRESNGAPFTWCALLEDHTSAAFDRDAALRAGDFLSEVLKLVDAASVTSPERSDLQSELAFFNHDKVRRILKDSLPEGEEFEQILRDAESLCVAQLSEALK
ncbi:MAG: DNA repair exonuclease [Tepidiformaceae bacterium]